jgi:hypothetical protein
MVFFTNKFLELQLLKLLSSAALLAMHLLAAVLLHAFKLKGYRKIVPVALWDFFIILIPHGNKIF